MWKRLTAVFRKEPAVVRKEPIPKMWKDVDKPTTKTSAPKAPKEIVINLAPSSTSSVEINTSQELQEVCIADGDLTIDDILQGDEILPIIHDETRELPKLPSPNPSDHGAIQLPLSRAEAEIAAKRFLADIYGEDIKMSTARPIRAPSESTKKARYGSIFSRFETKPFASKFLEKKLRQKSTKQTKSIFHSKKPARRPLGNFPPDAVNPDILTREFLEECDRKECLREEAYRANAMVEEASAASVKTSIQSYDTDYDTPVIGNVNYEGYHETPNYRHCSRLEGDENGHCCCTDPVDEEPVLSWQEELRLSEEWKQRDRKREYLRELKEIDKRVRHEDLAYARKMYKWAEEHEIPVMTEEEANRNPVGITYGVKRILSRAVKPGRMDPAKKFRVYVE